LLRAFARPGSVVAFSLPFAFNISYWYGFLPTLLAIPFGLLAIASFAQVLRSASTGRWTLAYAGAAAFAMGLHFLPFAAACVGIAAPLLRGRRAPADHVRPRSIAADETRPSIAEQFRVFDALIVFGDGPLPSHLNDFRVVARDGSWRRLERSPGRAPFW
jgi:hypothetical protein